MFNVLKSCFYSFLFDPFQTLALESGIDVGGYSFLQIFQALRWFFLPNLPGPTLIPCPTSIKDSKSICSVHGNYSFLNMEIVTNSKSCRDISIFNFIYWFFPLETREETIWGSTVLAHSSVPNRGACITFIDFGKKFSNFTTACPL